MISCQGYCSLSLASCLHGIYGFQRKEPIYSKPGLMEKCTPGWNALMPVLSNSHGRIMIQAQAQALMAETNTSLITKEFAEEDEEEEDEESIIGGIDVSALVRKVPSEPSLRRSVRMIDIVMKRNIRISINTFSALLQRCAREKDLESGKKVHEQLLEDNYKANVLLANLLIDMYAKCGSPDDAQKVFDEMSKHNIYSWTGLISAYANKGMVVEAINVFKDMQNAGNKPDKSVYVVLLQACGSTRDLNRGKQLHRQLIRNGLASDLTVGNALIDMYAHCGSLNLAQDVFDRLSEQNVLSWTALIAGYVREGFDQDALALFAAMLEQEVLPEEATLVSVLQACVNAMDLELGVNVHGVAINSDYESSLIVGNALVEMYLELGDPMCACVVFNKMYEHTIESWSAIIAGHVKQGLGEEALSLYEQMQGLEWADEKTLASVIWACGSLGALGKGREVHDEVVKSGYDQDITIGNSLISLYANCKCVNDARLVFDAMSAKDEATWTEMVTGYTEHGFANEAIALFNDMKGQNLITEVVTFASLLKACTYVRALEWGRQIHAMLIGCGLCSDTSLGSTLIDMYARCGCKDNACVVFQSRAARDVNLFTAIVEALTQQGYAMEALSLFEAIKDEGWEPKELFFVSILQVCASVGAVAKGQGIHISCVDNGLEMESSVANAFLDMYAKCGKMDLAGHFFTRLWDRNLDSWNALIGGFAQQGHATVAIALFKRVLEDGLKPSDLIFASLLSGCSRAGLINEGRHLFDSMKEYGITPSMDHYACMVDLLCRAGHMAEAENFVRKMHREPDGVVQMTLARAYIRHGKLELARNTLQKVLQLSPSEFSEFVLLWDMLEAVGMLEEQAMVQQIMDNRGIPVILEHSSIEVNNQLCTFMPNKSFHPQIEDIHAELRRLYREMQILGHTFKEGFTSIKVEDDTKGFFTCHHSSQLAISLGLISIPEESPINVTKNLRICHECHTSTKLISKFTNREILLRDASFFHVFKDGTCSCRDYW